MKTSRAKPLPENIPVRTTKAPDAFKVKAVENTRAKVIKFGKQNTPEIGLQSKREPSGIVQKRASFAPVKVRKKAKAPSGKMSAGWWADKVKP